VTWTLATKKRARWIDDTSVSEPLWASYATSRSVDTRNALVSHYWPLTRIEAVKCARLIPVDTDELTSFGTFGLINAVERFDPRKGVRFPTYAAHRIRGAILDELRHLDWVPRSVRSDDRATARAKERLAGVLGREPSEDELAEVLGMSVSDLRRRRARSATVPLSLDELVENPDHSDGCARQLIDATARPDQSASVAELRQHLAEAVARLSELDRTLLALRYAEDLPVTKISSVLGVTTSCGQRMFNAALEHLEASIQGERSGDWR
jgi:RNA polymerase sigma factor for flagellar operon FliA